MKQWINEHPVLAGIVMICLTAIICTALYATSRAPEFWVIMGSVLAVAILVATAIGFVAFMPSTRGAISDSPTSDAAPPADRSS